jgi:type IV pilus assembly protein PilW
MSQTIMLPASPPCRQRGYSLIELSVAMLIAIFLLGGLFSILQTTRNASNSQTALAQLQDNERMAMTLLTQTIQNAGYFPNPLGQTAVLAFPSDSAFATAGQVLTGGTNSMSHGIGQTITVRYQTESTGVVLGCLGAVDTPINSSHEYQLFVQGDAPTYKTSSLYCSVDGGTAVQLVPNVSNIAFTYGVDTTGGANTLNGVTAYIPTANMNSTYWTNVYSVSIQLTFPNPLLNQPGQSNAGQTLVPTISFTRVIGLPVHTGS